MNMQKRPESAQIALFRGKTIRRTLYRQEWWFSVIDVVSTLTDSVDIKQYVKKMHQRDPELHSNWGTICTPLEMTARDGKRRKVICANTAGIFRIIQSIPSPMAEPFKQWLAKVGYERIQEIADPEFMTPCPHFMGVINRYAHIVNDKGGTYVLVFNQLVFT